MWNGHRCIMWGLFIDLPSWKDMVFLHLQLQAKGCPYCFKMSCNACLQLTFKTVPLGTLLNRKILVLFLPISQPQLRHNSNKTQSLKSPCETSALTHENPICRCTEVLERMNGRYTAPSLKRNRNRKEHNALTYFLKFWNFVSLQRWSVGYAGAPLTQ